MVGMGFLKDHPRTAITDTIYTIVSSPDYPIEQELGKVVRLIRDAIEVDDNDYQYTLNQEETARCIRKKLKWGNEIQQYRSLQLFNCLIMRGLRFGIIYNDSKLIERLTVIALNQKSDGNGQSYSKKVIQYLRSAILDWYDYIRSRHYESKRTYESIINLYGYVRDHKMNKADTSTTRKSSKNKGGKTRRSKSNFMNDSADESVYTGAGAGSSGIRVSSQSRNRADTKYRIPTIDMRKEGPKIQIIISNALAAAIALENALVVLPAGMDSMDSEDATAKFIQARTIRRKVLRYLQLVTEGEFLGSLLHANDELVKALTEYDNKSQGDENPDEDSYSTEESDNGEEDSLANYESDFDESDGEDSGGDNGWTVNTHPSVRVPEERRRRRQNSFTEDSVNDPFSDQNKF